MLSYQKGLKKLSRKLRSNLTDSERILWSKLRRKQICGIPFYRQKPIGNYIVDFYAPKINLIIEIDGSQHLEEGQRAKDKQRDEYLNRQGLKVLRVTNIEVFENIEGLVDQIYNFACQKIKTISEQKTTRKISL